jgi:hypothetical protein
MEIPDYIRAQIQTLIAKARTTYTGRDTKPVEHYMATARGQADFLKAKYMRAVGKELDPELENELEKVLEVTDDPTANQYLQEISRMVEELRKGRNFDGSA